jgi:hypothetical protein
MSEQQSLIEIKNGDEVAAEPLEGNFKYLEGQINKKHQDAMTLITAIQQDKISSNQAAKIGNDKTPEDAQNIFYYKSDFKRTTTFSNNVSFNKTNPQDEKDDTITTFNTKVILNNELNTKNKVTFDGEVKLTDEMYSSLCTKMMPNLASSKNDRMPKTVYAENQNGYLFVQDGYSKGVYWSLFVAIKDEKPTEGKEVTWYKYNFDNLNASSENRVLCVPIANKFQYKILRVDANGDELTDEFPTGHFKQLYFIPCIGG